MQQPNTPVLSSGAQLMWVAACVLLLGLGSTSRADPLADINGAKRTHMVFKSGQVIDMEKLNLPVNRWAPDP